VYPFLLVDDHVTEDPHETPNALNKFFSSCKSGRSDPIILPPSAINSLLTIQPFNFVAPSYEEIESQLNKLPSTYSSKPDGIPAIALKIIGPLIINPLINIFTLSFEQSKFCKLWKNSEITPLNKIPIPKKVSDYRPITKTCLLSKIIEKIAYAQINNYLESNSLLSNKQFGFRKKKSTDSLLLFLTSSWRHILDQKPNPLIGIISLDIQKAFDNINHDLLAHKLKTLFHFSSSAINWIIDYISNRTIITKFNNATSTPAIINRGIPQGGVLSPLLFNVFVNDLIQYSPTENIALFADDCLLYFVDHSIHELQLKISSDINKVLHWYTDNDLVVNTSKTKILILDTSNNSRASTPFFIGGDTILSSPSLKYLGCILDQNLKLTFHVKTLCLKVSKCINLLKCLYQYIKPQSKLFYTSYIRPLLENNPLFLYAVSKTNSNYLEKIQNRALKIICGVKFNKQESTNLTNLRELYNLLLLSRRQLCFTTHMF